MFEGSDSFHVLPTFGIVPTYHSPAPYDMKDIISNSPLPHLSKMFGVSP